MSDASLKANPATGSSDSAGMTLLEKLAQRVHAFDKRQLTKRSVAQAKACILDAIGVTLAGHPETLHPNSAQNSGRGDGARTGADIRHGAAHQHAGWVARQRHGLACARFR